MDSEDFFDSPVFFLVPPFDFRVILLRREPLAQDLFINHGEIMSWPRKNEKPTVGFWV